MLIYVASRSQYKLLMVTDVATQLFELAPSELTVEGFDIPSGVAEYPRTADELCQGVQNRMAYLQHYYADADYCVAQQGGALCVGTKLFESGIVQVRNQEGRVTSALRTGIPISPDIEANIHSSQGPMDIIEKRTGKRHEGGFAGYVTNGALSAYETYRIATIVAFQAQLT